MTHGRHGGGGSLELGSAEYLADARSLAKFPDGGILLRYIIIVIFLIRFQVGHWITPFLLHQFRSKVNNRGGFKVLVYICLSFYLHVPVPLLSHVEQEFPLVNLILVQVDVSVPNHQAGSPLVHNPLELVVHIIKVRRSLFIFIDIGLLFVFTLHGHNGG